MYFKLHSTLRIDLEFSFALTHHSARICYLHLTLGTLLIISVVLVVSAVLLSAMNRPIALALIIYY
jgi:hypothetical protein